MSRELAALTRTLVWHWRIKAEGGAEGDGDEVLAGGTAELCKPAR